MAFRTLVIFACIAALAVSFSDALTIQEWGYDSSLNVKVYDDIELHPPRENQIREAKFNYPQMVSFQNYKPL